MTIRFEEVTARMLSNLRQDLRDFFHVVCDDQDLDDRLLPANIISVYIVRLRRNMPPGSIATIHGVGYQLTETGYEAVRAVVEGAPR